MSIDDFSVIQTPDGYYRFVSHERKLLTTGFESEEALLKNRNIIRFDKGTKELMAARYEKVFLRA